MASLIPGYEYDIFISYRQKDNKYDGWVTEFVDNLKRELEATFKEEVSVYFDINPHDGLLETHDVDASLKEKLKCLVFIPIISRTYCDPKSFAWEHEFKAFVDEASKDQFGLKVKLPNGNVANRVLPVRIHDLDAMDIKLCESVLGGVLRGVEFIYKEPGVNKPLTSEDDEKRNLNRTKYRIQINKIANALKEIISGLMSGEVLSGKEKEEPQLPWEEAKKGGKTIPEEKRPGFKKSKLLSYIISVVFVLILIGVYIYPKIFKRDALERLRSSGEKISIAVLPFQNMTNDTTWNGLQDIIQINLISAISESKELTVSQIGTIITLLKAENRDQNAAFSLTTANTLSKKLDNDIFIYGSIQKAGTSIRLIAQLIDTRKGTVIKAIEVNGPYKTENIIGISDTLRKNVTDYLLISKLIRENPWYGQFPEITRSPDAYRYFILGEKLKNSFLNQKDLAMAEDWYKRSLAADSNFLEAMNGLKDVYNFMGRTEEALKWVLRMYTKREQWAPYDQIGISWVYANYFEPPEDRLKYLDQLLQIDDKNPTLHWLLGCGYNEINQPAKAIPELEKAIDLLHKWGIDDSWYYGDLGKAYRKSGQLEKERELYKKAEIYVKEDRYITADRAELSLIEKDTIVARKYIEKYSSFCKENSLSEAETASGIAWIYWNANIQDKAEQYFRKALLLEPGNPDRMKNLADRLIEWNKDFDEAYRLFDKAIGLAANKWDYYTYMDAKGMGLYKQGRIMEALEILQKIYDFAPYKLFYMKAHLEEVKKAIAGQQ